MKKFKSLIFLLLAINVFALADNEVNSKKLEKIFNNIAENKNTDKNVWVLTSKSLFVKEHVDPAIKQMLDNFDENLVLIARDDVSRLYYFPKISSAQRVPLEKVFNPKDENIIKIQAKREYSNNKHCFEIPSISQ